MARLSRELMGEREREVLRAVVESHIGNAAPVGSRTLAGQTLAELGVSAATVRNIMAELGEKGYVSKTHTSSGRIPTTNGYRIYIEDLMMAKRLSGSKRKMIDGCLIQSIDNSEAMVEMVSGLIARLSRNAAVVLLPKVSSAIIEKVHFIWISDRRILLVLVLATGGAQNLLVDLEEELQERELSELANFINHNYAGLTLKGIRRELLKDISGGNAEARRLGARALRINEKLVSNHEAMEVSVDGAAAFLDAPEFRNDSGKLRKMFKLLSDKRRLLRILDKCLDENKVVVELGLDLEGVGMEDCAILARSCGGGDDRLEGAVGIIGPLRMDYPYLVGLLDYFSQSLHNIVERGRA